MLFMFFRETLIGQLYEYIKGLKSDFQSKSTFSKGEGPPKGHNMPEIINYVMWGRQLEARVSYVVIFQRIVFISNCHRY